MTSRRFVTGFSVAFAVAACLVTWLVLGEWSPFHDYFLAHPVLKNLVMKLTIVPYVVVMIIKPGTDFGDILVATVVEFLQWLVLGCFLGVVINAFFRRRHADRTKLSE